MRRAMLWLLGALALFTLLAVAALWLGQDGLIYHPRAYTADEVTPSGWIELSGEIDGSRWTAFYVPARSGARPARLWLLFNGNASLALDWRAFVERHPDTEAGFLLVEYPGYGRSTGTPSPATIDAATEAARQALTRQLGTLPAAQGAVGYSLGAAVALSDAVRHPEVRRVVLLALFTSMAEMARLTVGRPLHLLTRHRFDNRARLADLAAQPAPPQVTIFHGTQDATIPVGMSRTLAAEFPTVVHLTEMPGVGHPGLVTAAGAHLDRATTAP